MKHVDVCSVANKYQHTHSHKHMQVPLLNTHMYKHLLTHLPQNTVLQKGVCNKTAHTHWLTCSEAKSHTQAMKSRSLRSGWSLEEWRTELTGSSTTTVNPPGCSAEISLWLAQSSGGIKLYSANLPLESISPNVNAWVSVMLTLLLLQVTFMSWCFTWSLIFTVCQKNRLLQFQTTDPLCQG